MNLMKSFNLNYLIQNLKKSKVILSIFIGLIPILNTIIQIMNLTINETEILSLGQISSLSLIGTYFLPIIISICLFNYIYKKKSVDFINSMPISRKSIFITNTILGIIIIILTILINSILTLIVCQILNRPIPIAMLLDYFGYLSLVYIFVFTATNLAMTISGNAITQIVVTLLLLFLIPYISIFTKALYKENIDNTYLKCTTSECKPDKYYCYDDELCLTNQKNNLYPIYIEEVKENTYTAPFAIIYNSLLVNNNKINLTSNIKMIILSIIYIILGYKLFKLRKMEVSETSFKNIHHHNLVKSLTLIPIATIAYVLLSGTNLISSIFVVVIMLIYFLVYDLITKKSITNIKLTSLYFITTIIIVVGACYIIENNTSKNFTLNHKNITSIAIDLSSEINSSYKRIIYSNNPKLINLVIKSGLNDYDYTYNTLNIYIKTKDNKEYRTYFSFDEQTYKEILKLLEEEKSYLDAYKNINTKNIYAIKVGNNLYTKKEAKKYLDIIENTLNNITIEEFINLQNKYVYYNDNYNITLYSYKEHNRRDLTISGYINYDLLNAIINDYNKELSNNISNIIPEDYYIYYENSYLNNTYNMDYYVLKSAKNEIYEFILKNMNDKIDMKQEYFSFNIKLNGKNYIFTTNKTNEIKNILETKYQEIKDTNDYKNYYENNYKDGVVKYYD